jgi:hypothetical protein
MLIDEIPVGSSEFLLLEEDHRLVADAVGQANAQLASNVGSVISEALPDQLNFLFSSNCK